MPDGTPVPGKTVLKDVGPVVRIGGEVKRGGRLKLDSKMDEVRRDRVVFAGGQSVTSGPVESAWGDVRTGGTMVA